MTISKETAIWISAYSKVQELFEYIRYAYVATYTEGGAEVMMERGDVLELWEKLGDAVLNGVKESMYNKLGEVNLRSYEQLPTTRGRLPLQGIRPTDRPYRDGGGLQRPCPQCTGVPLGATTGIGRTPLHKREGDTMQ